MRGFVPVLKCRVGCAAVVVLATTMGFVGSAPSAAEAAAKHVVSARTTHTFAMPAPGIATVQTIKLTAGAWTVIGNATAVDEGASDFVRCALTDLEHGTQLDSATAFVGSAGTRAGILTNLATVVVPTGSTVHVVQGCGHDGAAGDSASLDVGASIVAFQSVDGTATSQAIARTTGNTALTQSEASVLTLPLDSGTYAIGVKLTGVTFSGDATVTCTLRAAGGYTADLTTSLGTTTAAATNAYFTYVTGFDSLDLSCYETGAPGAYLDPSAVLWARKVKAVTAVEGGCGARLINGTTDLVALVRQGGQCVIPGGNPAQLSSAYVAKGTWVAISSESSVVGSDTASGYTRCLLVGDSLDLGDARAWNAPAKYYGLSTLGTLKLTEPGYFSENCGRDGPATEATTTYGALLLIRA